MRKSHIIPTIVTLNLIYLITILLLFSVGNTIVIAGGTGHGDGLEGLAEVEAFDGELGGSDTVQKIGERKTGDRGDAADKMEQQKKDILPNKNDENAIQLKQQPDIIVKNNRKSKKGKDVNRDHKKQKKQQKIGKKIQKQQKSMLKTTKAGKQQATKKQLGSQSQSQSQSQSKPIIKTMSEQVAKFGVGNLNPNQLLGQNLNDGQTGNKQKLLDRNDDDQDEDEEDGEAEYTNTEEQQTDELPPTNDGIDNQDQTYYDSADENQYDDQIDGDEDTYEDDESDNNDDSDDDDQDDEDYQEDFQDFTQQYSKQYQPQQRGYRYQIYQKNSKRVQSHNKNNPSYQIKQNKFSDLSQSQFQSLYLMQQMPQMPSIQFPPWSAPQDFEAKPIDWRHTLGPAKAQKNCGACYAFTVLANIQSMIRIQKDVGMEFSVQQVVECCKDGCNGCRGGWPAAAFLYLSKDGLADEQDYPYVGLTEQQCNQRVNRKKYIDQKSPLTPIQDTNALAYALQVSPVTVIIDASTWDSLYSRGTFDKCPPEPQQQSQQKLNYNHAVLCMGIAENGDWIIRNTWGDDWGDAGHIYLPAGNSCGIADLAIVPNLVLDDLGMLPPGV